jgi:hypothetical protein
MAMTKRHAALPIGLASCGAMLIARIASTQFTPPPAKPPYKQPKPELRMAIVSYLKELH